MNKYDVRRQRVALNSQADQNILKNYEQMYKTGITEGVNLINTIGDAYGKEQAAERNRKKNDEFNIKNSEGYFSYKENIEVNEDGTETRTKQWYTPEESMQKYDEWSREFDENYTDANNIWAQKYTNANDEAYRTKRLPEIFKSTAQAYQAYAADKNTETAARTYDYTITGSTGDYVYDVCLANDISPETLGGNEKLLFDVATGAVESDLYTPTIAARGLDFLVSAQNNGIRYDDAWQYFQNTWLPNAAVHDLKENADSFFTDYVINGDMSIYDAETQLDDILSQVGTVESGNRKGFINPLSDTAKATLKTSILQSWKGLENGAIARTSEIYNSQVLPLMKANIRDGKLAISREELEGIEGFNEKWLPEEMKADFENLMDMMDEGRIVQSTIERLNAISSSSIPEDQKEKHISRIIAEAGDYRIQKSINRMADSSMYMGSYTSYTREDIAAKYNSMFEEFAHYLPEGRFDPKNAADPAYDKDVQALLGNMDVVSAIVYGNIGSEYYVDGILATDMAYNIQKIYEDYYADELEGLTQKEIDERFEEWLPEFRSFATGFMDKYGDQAINSDGTTLRNYYDAELKEVQDISKWSSDGFYTIDPSDPIGIRNNSAAYNNVLNMFATSSKENWDYVVTSYLQTRSMLTKDQQKIGDYLMNMEENGQDLLSSFGAGIDSIIARKYPLINSTEEKDAVRAFVFEDIMRDVFESGGDINTLRATLATRTEDSVKDALTVMQGAIFSEVTGGGNYLPENSSSGMPEYTNASDSELFSSIRSTYSEVSQKIDNGTLPRPYKEMASEYSNTFLNSQNGRLLLDENSGLTEDQKLSLISMNVLGVDVNYDADASKEEKEKFWKDASHNVKVQLDNLDDYFRSLAYFAINATMKSVDEYSYLHSEGLSISGPSASDPSWFIARKISADTENGRVYGKNYEVRSRKDIHGNKSGFFVREIGETGMGEYVHFGSNFNAMGAEMNNGLKEYYSNTQSINEEYPWGTRRQEAQRRFQNVVDYAYDNNLFPEVKERLDMIYNLTGDVYRPKVEYSRLYDFLNGEVEPTITFEKVK